MLVCQYKDCDVPVHSYEQLNTLYCFRHGQEEIYKFCKTCRNYLRFRRNNKDCYHCVLRRSVPLSILEFMSYQRQSNTAS